MAKIESPDLGDQETRARLRRLLDRLKDDLGPAIEVQDDDGDWWMAWVTPTRPGALGFGWIYRGDIIFQLDVGGVRWELGRTPEDLDFIEKITQALIDGRVYSIQAPHRVRVVVTLPDGSRETSTTNTGLRGCLPLPFWTRWGQRTRHVPYR
ncbi:hypothetical protein [Thermomonospora cellulosilytica]|uniref:Uncharacterized protein n=1 Tax=Thermomonospora cellulosilytica TaxID=1411118 RepID=A0A7W3MWA8_9ACTN|nr:hypothetical protein [Thermomonospora cellulosilytica]MBA9003056.1 hypothetical protein [Thermomonospora cellulosilytica]